MTSLDVIVDTVVDALEQKKASSIAVFDVEGNTAITDRVVIVSANNEVHCKALVETLHKLGKEADFRGSEDVFDPARVSGSPDSGWVVIDMNSVLVHVLTATMRAHYDLDTIYEKRANTVEHV